MAVLKGGLQAQTRRNAENFCQFQNTETQMMSLRVRVTSVLNSYLNQFNYYNYNSMASKHFGAPKSLLSQTTYHDRRVFLKQ